MRKVLYGLLTVMLFLTGCKEKTIEEKQKIRIGISYYDSYDPFIMELSSRIEKQLNECENVIVKSVDSEKSQSTQNRQVSDMLSDSYDVICVNLVDRTAPKKIISMAEDSNVPVIFFNRELVSQDLESWTRLYYVGADAGESGKMQGEIVSDYIKEHPEVDKNQDGKIQYIILEGETGHQDAIVRTDVSIQTISDAGIVLDKLSFAIANWNRSQACTKTKQLLSKFNTNIELILANNDEMAIGAIQALAETGIVKEQWPIVIGIDGTEDGLEQVKEGNMIGTVYNDGIKQSDAIADLSIALAKNESLDSFNLKNGRYIRSPYQKVTIENVDDYLKLLQ